MKKFLNLFVIGCVLWMSAGAPHVFAAYSFERTVTIDHTKVPNTDQVGFPIEIASTTYTFLKTVANGGKVQNAEGFDIGFYNNADCATGKMAWEVEKYVPTTGEVVFFATTTAAVSHTSDTVFYMCYGDASITTDQSATTTVWDSHYKSVWHMAQNAGNTTVAESTRNAITGTASKNTSLLATTGQIDGGFNFSAAGPDYFTGGTSALLGGNTAPHTIEFWMNTTSFNGTQQVPFSLQTNAPNTPMFADMFNNISYNDIAFGVANTAATVRLTFPASVPNTWYHVAATYNGGSNYATTGNWAMYVNGASRTVTAGSGFGGVTSANNYVGTYFNSTPSLGYGGALDEFRVSDIQRSADWIATEYNNELLPDKAGGSSGFYTLGAETPFGPTVSTPFKLSIFGLLKVFGLLKI